MKELFKKFLNSRNLKIYIAGTNGLALANILFFFGLYHIPADPDLCFQIVLSLLFGTLGYKTLMVIQSILEIKKELKNKDDRNNN
ncbi:MAG: hypothetical protein ULS35scaffold63_42 [Phage 33_17]|nr:MAG: hypothetical protein ULS35scaffold63_42 [Phage 33_17]